jgi:hypothetical protein
LASQKELNLKLIARYKSEASTCREASALNAAIAFNPADLDEKTRAPASSKARVENKGGVVTVNTSGANLLPQSADKTKIFGPSSISIPEYRLYRK